MLPGPDAPEIDWLLFEQQGVITWRQAVAELGLGKVRHLVATRRWRRICRGVLITHSGQLTRGQQWWVAVLAAGDGAVLAGLAAAKAGGLRTFREDDIDILVPIGRRAPDLAKRLPVDEMPLVVVHRTRNLPDEHVQVGRPMRTTMARAVVDAAGWARTDQRAHALIAAACQQRLSTPAEVLDVTTRLPRAPRHKLIVETAHDVAGGAQALGEIDFLKLCRRYGFPRPDLQVRRRDAQGRVRYLDAYWSEYHLHVEVDGAHHMDVREWESDLARQSDVWLAGDRILRFSAWQVRWRPDEVAPRTRAALVQGGWQHTSPG